MVKRVLFPGEALLAKGPGHVAVLDHVLDLALHGQEEECEKVYEQDWPEDGHVENPEEREKQRKNCSLDGGEPAKTKRQREVEGWRGEQHTECV